MNNEIEIERTHRPTRISVRTGGLMVLITMALGLSACAGLEATPRAQNRLANAEADTTTLERRHATLEGAAIHALADAWDATRTWNRDRLRVGSIVRIDGEYVWLEPETAQSASRPVVRVDLSQEHAATYIVHPRPNTLRDSRANEQISSRQKRLVDRIDPLHRPVYLLTPSGRLLKYAYGEEVVEVASIRDRSPFADRSPARRVADVAQAH